MPVLPEVTCLVSRYARYLTQRTRLGRIPQGRSQPPVFYGLCPAFYLLKIHLSRPWQLVDLSPPALSEDTDVFPVIPKLWVPVWWQKLCCCSISSRSQQQNFLPFSCFSHLCPTGTHHVPYVGNDFPFAFLWKATGKSSPAASPKAFPAAHIALANSLPHHNISTTSHLRA